MLIRNECRDNAAVSVIELVEAASLNYSNRDAGIFCKLGGDSEAGSPTAHDAILELSACHTFRVEEETSATHT